MTMQTQNGFGRIVSLMLAVAACVCAGQALDVEAAATDRRPSGSPSSRGSGSSYISNDYVPEVDPAAEARAAERAAERAAARQAKREENERQARRAKEIED